MPVNDAERDGPARVQAHLEEQRQSRVLREELRRQEEQATWQYKFAERVLVLLERIAVAVEK